MLAIDNNPILTLIEDNVPLDPVLCGFETIPRKDGQ